MASIQVYQFAVIDIDGRQVKMGSLSLARNVTIGDDEVNDTTFEIASSTATKIWDKSESLGDFDFLYLEADFDIQIQFTADATGNSNYFVAELKGSGTANEMGPALILGSDLALQSNGTVDLFTGTADTIDEIWAYHDGTGNDTVRLRRVVAT